MNALLAAAAIAVCLGLQAGLGRLSPEAHRFVDFMALPVIWYGLTRSQRSAMMVGCASGLLQDAWFRVGVFGLGGFKKTLLGWLLGGLGGRFDLNHAPGRMAAGVAFSLADTAVDIGLRALLDLREAPPALAEVAIRAATTGALVVAAFGLVERVRPRREPRPLG